MMNKIVFFHRNLQAGYSINKVTQTLTRQISERIEYYVPCYRATLSSTIKNLCYIFKHRDRKQINHITGGIHYGIIALLGCKSVLTIHDTGPYDNCQSKLKKLFFYYFWFRWPIKMASKVVCISEATKRKALRFYNQKEILVIYNSIDQLFEQRGSQKEKVYSKERVLIIGTAYNKNICRTIKALKGLPCQLRIIGELSDEYISCLKDNGIDYINKADLTDEEIYQEYCDCNIVSFCSTYEGFGMPIIEANAVGRVVICSNIEPLREVALNAALLVNPYDVSDMRRGFLRLLEDHELKKNLILRGFENVQRFSSDSILREYQKVYNELRSK